MPEPDDEMDAYDRRMADLAQLDEEIWQADEAEYHKDLDEQDAKETNQ
ncbi:hypothetical protein [Streptomyces sp. NBC_01264]|nr:hypothetical protein [Streptomyces sp. NBC_01264]MCX4780922.1 hypothetical protein [Streptomyces sp. NBC_01264]